MSARVALLRGINVGRGNRIAMADLRACLEEAGFGEVRTLLASGNVVFDASGSAANEALAERLHDAVLARFDLDARVLVLDGESLDAVIHEHPWRERDLDPSRVLIMFPMGEEPTTAPADQLKDRDWGDEEVFVGQRAVHLHCPHGMSAGELAEQANRCMGSDVTTRNWRTLMRIVDSMNSLN